MATLKPLLLLLLLSLTVAGAGAGADMQLRAVCRMTHHRALCERSLAAFSGAAHDPRGWAEAAASAALAEAERVALLIQSAPPASHSGALADCAECFGDAAASLRLVLEALRQPARTTTASDVEAWVSAAAADESTCLDGLFAPAGVAGDRKEREVVRRKVVNATYLCSNALAFAHKLAST